MQSTACNGAVGTAEVRSRVLPSCAGALLGTEVTTSLQSGLVGRRTATFFEAESALEIAAAQVSSHSDCIPGRLGP